jgi:hypothetical protein
MKHGKCPPHAGAKRSVCQAQTGFFITSKHQCCVYWSEDVKSIFMKVKGQSQELWLTYCIPSMCSIISTVVAQLGDGRTSVGDGRSSVGDGRSSVGDGRSSVG